MLRASRRETFHLVSGVHPDSIVRASLDSEAIEMVTVKNCLEVVSAVSDTTRRTRYN